MAKFRCLLILSLVLLVSIAGATQFKVGGSKGWSVPNDPKEYGQWAQKHRFQVGDQLLFVYLPDTDSVLLVNETSYRNCDTSTPVDTFDDGNTVFVFTRPGPYHFISGNRDNCLKNESLVVVVMAARSNRSTGQAPSPSASASPPPPGSTEFVPSSSPNGEGSNSPPPPPPPPPPPNGASSRVMGVMGSLGAFVGSLFCLL